MNDIEVSEGWSEIITPQNNFLDFRFKELWRYRDLMLLFVKRDFVAQYKQTILGPLWNIIQPILTTLMFLIVFNKIAKISTDALPPVLFYMSSITIWNYFSSCFTATSSTFITNAAIFGKVYFPRLILPLSNVTSNLIKFFIQFCLLLATTLYYVIFYNYKFNIGWHSLLIPVIAIIMALLGLALGIIISSLTTKYRDFTVLVNFGVALLMYVTPVAYPLSYLAKSKYKFLIEWNPLSPLVEGFRYAFFGNGSFDFLHFTYSIIWMLICLLSGVVIFNRVERTFMDTV